MKLYTYFRSSAAYRVRIALNLKGIAYDLESVNLLHGAQKSEPYLSLNPQGLVPALELDSGTIITQSNAILEWIEEQYSSFQLYPNNPEERALTRAFCSVIGSDIHPIDNLRVLKYLTGELNISEEQKTAWYHHWIALGLETLEQQIVLPYCLGETPSMADAYLIPQVYNAIRFNMDLTPYPKIQAVYAHCNEHPAFIDARPENQEDAT